MERKSVDGRKQFLEPFTSSNKPIPRLTFNMATTINSPLSLRAVLVLLAFGSCQGYQLPHQRTAFLTTNQQRSLSNACPRLHIGADFDSDFEAALGQAPLSEYEKDAEFYSKRNEEYYNSRRKAAQEEEDKKDAGAK